MTLWRRNFCGGVCRYFPAAFRVKKRLSLFREWLRKHECNIPAAVANFINDGIFAVLPLEYMCGKSVGNEFSFERFSHFGNLRFCKSDGNGSGSTFRFRAFFGFRIGIEQVEK